METPTEKEQLSSSFPNFLLLRHEDPLPRGSFFVCVIRRCFSRLTESCRRVDRGVRATKGSAGTGNV